MAAQRGRLRWRHVLVVVLGAVVELLSFIYAYTLYEPIRGGYTLDERWIRHFGRGLIPVLAVTYFLGVIVATYRFSRFNRSLMVRVFPRVFLLSVLIVVLASVEAIGQASLTGVPVGGSTEGGGRVIRRRYFWERRAKQTNLAELLFDTREAELMTGLSLPCTESSFSRIGSASIYSVSPFDSKARITLIVRHLSAKAKERLNQKGKRDGVQYLGMVLRRENGADLWKSDWVVSCTVVDMPQTVPAQELASKLVTTAMNSLGSGER
jgi:hypothetical protein